MNENVDQNQDKKIKIFLSPQKNHITQVIGNKYSILDFWYVNTYI